jgi:hypothetical protein
VEHFDWVHNPLGVPATFIPPKAQDTVMDLKTDRTFKLKFHEQTLYAHTVAISKERIP